VSRLRLPITEAGLRVAWYRCRTATSAKSSLVTPNPCTRRRARQRHRDLVRISDSQQIRIIYICWIFETVVAMADRLAELVDVRLASAGVALVTLNLPQVRNAMTTELTAAWTTAMDNIAGDRSLRAVVVTGAGSVFCAGADLSWFDQGNLSDNTPDRLRDKMLPFYRAWLAPQQIPVPVVAAVNGPCIGAGLCLALACDLRYASPSAMFSAPFTQLGMHGGMAVSWLLPEAVGMPRAREMLYTGRVVAADDALSWGLVSEVAEDVVGRALEVAESVAQAAPIAIRLTKAGLAQGSRGGFEVALQWEALAQPVTMATADIHKGIQARREHRPPAFDGS
jgi:enoyl-CoA hydratase/carnithine racemase